MKTTTATVSITSSDLQTWELILEFFYVANANSATDNANRLNNRYGC